MYESWTGSEFSNKTELNIIKIVLTSICLNSDWFLNSVSFPSYFAWNIWNSFQSLLRSNCTKVIKRIALTVPFAMKRKHKHIAYNVMGWQKKWEISSQVLNCTVVWLFQVLFLVSPEWHAEWKTENHLHFLNPVDLLLPPSTVILTKIKNQRISFFSKRSVYKSYIQQKQYHISKHH